MAKRSRRGSSSSMRARPGNTCTCRPEDPLLDKVGGINIRNTDEAVFSFLLFNTFISYFAYYMF